MKTHELYKETRMTATSRYRRVEIAKMMVDLAKEIAVPQGVKNYEICDYKK